MVSTAELRRRGNHGLRVLAPRPEIGRPDGATVRLDPVSVGPADHTGVVDGRHAVDHAGAAGPAAVVVGTALPRLHGRRLRPPAHEVGRRDMGPARDSPGAGVSGFSWKNRW
jgi:hypothetical protein